MTGSNDAERASGDPLVSIIIPTYNLSRMLRLTMQTALAQDFTDFEVLIVGDGCTDDSENVVASFGDPRLRWYNLPTNSGAPAIPINTAVPMTRGRYVAHLAHDDFWLPWHLSGLLETIEESGADWVYPLVVAIGPDGIRHCTGPPQPGVPHAEHHVPPSGWLYRREVFADVGPWARPETLPWPIDFDFERRAALAGKRFAFRSRPTVLKFPSPLFPEGYRSGKIAPIQQEYFERIRDDPEALEDEMLRELATRFAQIDRGGGKSVFARKQRGATTKEPIWWTARRWFITLYGAERWPVPQLIQGEFQANRLRRRPQRGLGPDPSQAPDAVASPADSREAARPERAKRHRRGLPRPGAAERMAAREERRHQREVKADARQERILQRQQAFQRQAAPSDEPVDAGHAG